MQIKAPNHRALFGSGAAPILPPSFLGSANPSYLLIKAASCSFLLGNQALVWSSLFQNGVLKVIRVVRGGKCFILNGY